MFFESTIVMNFWMRTLKFLKFFLNLKTRFFEDSFQRWHPLTHSLTPSLAYCRHIALDMESRCQYYMTAWTRSDVYELG